ncbi:MAG: efflux RND transporter permease subunit, partial [Nannocystaceae bacterium]
MSIRLRLLMLGLLCVLLVAGGYAAKSLPVDAIPDVSNIQVSVLTEAPGLSAYEVERMVTFPMENALNGLPGMAELRSVSRADISAISIVFEDGTDPWFARQLVLERIGQARGDLPEGLPPPQLAPLSNGLGEIYQFVVRSDLHTQKQLRTLLDWEIVPRIRGVPGVIEVNTMGGDLKQYQVIARPSRLHAYGLTIRELAETLRKAGHEVVLTREPGGSQGAEEIRALVLQGDPDRWSAETEILLFTAARRDHLERTIAPALADGKIVICDRFADSTRMYQGRSGLRAQVDALHDTMIATEPDL